MNGQRVDLSLHDFFLARFVGLEPHEQIEIRPIHATSGRRFPRRFCATIEEAVEAVGLVPHGFEVYYGVNARCDDDGTKAGVTNVGGFHADVDDKHFGDDAEAGWEAIFSFELLPSAIVRSGHGWQVYWEFDRRYPAATHGARIEAMLARLQFRLGGIDAVQDISRIFRVPGTTNHKDPASPVECHVAYWSPRTHDLEAFEPYLPASPTPRLPEKEIDAVLAPGEKPTIEELGDLLRWIDPCLPYGDYYRIWAVVAYYYPDAAGLALVDDWSGAAREANGQYSSPRTQPEKHFGFRRQTGQVATIGTLVHYAKLGGYEPPRRALNKVYTAQRRRQIEEQLDDLPNPTYDELPYWLQRMYDHLGPLTDGLSRDLISLVCLTAYSICWKGIFFENLPLSLFCNVLMEQGSGKSKITAELEKVFKAVAGLGAIFYTHGSPQGMYKSLARSEGGRMYASYDEFGDFLATLKQEYMSGTRGILNGLYDGRDVSYQLSRESTVIDAPHLTLIATTTPRLFIKHVTDEDLEGGFASRFMYVAPPWSNAGQHGAPTKEQRQEVALAIGEHIAGLAHLTNARFDVSPGAPAPQAYRDFEVELGVGTGERRHLRDAIENPKHPLGRYLARVKRLAGVLELLELRPTISGNTVIVRDRNLNLALIFIRRTMVYQEMILELLTSTEDEQWLAKVERTITQKSPAGLTRSQIMQLAHIKANDLKRILPILEEAGVIEELAENGRLLWRTKGSEQWPVLPVPLRAIRREQGREAAD